MPKEGGAKNSARPTCRFVMRVFRAGFEPFRGRATSAGLNGPRNDHTLGVATRTHGSNPARSSQRRWYPSPRAEFSPHRALGGKSHWALPRFEHEHEDNLTGLEHRPLQIQPDIGGAFNIVDRAGADVVVFLLKIPASHGFDLKPFHRLVVKSDAGTIIIIL